MSALILEEIAIDCHNKETEQRLLQEAHDLHLSSLQLAKKAFGEFNVQTAKHYGNLGRLYQSMRKFKVIVISTGQILCLTCITLFHPEVLSWPECKVVSCSSLTVCQLSPLLLHLSPPVPGLKMKRGNRGEAWRGVADFTLFHTLWISWVKRGGGTMKGQSSQKKVQCHLIKIVVCNLWYIKIRI